MCPPFLNYGDRLISSFTCLLRLGCYTTPYTMRVFNLNIEHNRDEFRALLIEKTVTTPNLHCVSGPRLVYGPQAITMSESSTVEQ